MQSPRLVRALIGVDPSINNPGIAVLTYLGDPLVAGRRRWHAKTFIANAEGSAEDRVFRLMDSFRRVFAGYRRDLPGVPFRVAIEDSFVLRPRKYTARSPDDPARLDSRHRLLIWSQVPPVCAARSLHMPITWITPSTVKKCVTGKGNASKQQVAAALRAMLNSEQAAEVPENDNITDAMAVALAASETQTYTTADRRKITYDR